MRILDATTVNELKEAFLDYSLKKENARRKMAGEPPLSKGGYASSLRGTAGIFSKQALKFYKRNGYHIENPLAGEVPKADFEKFIVPPGGLDFIKELFEAAQNELSHEPQIYPIFLICLGAGLRVQEATHVSWKHIQAGGIYVRSDEVHRTKSGLPRLVPAGDSLKMRLLGKMPSDASPDDFVVPVLRDRTTGSGRPKKTKSRCDKAIKKLNAWLRQHGVTKDLTTHPCHYLRKLFGAVVLTKHPRGLALAKKYLGHESTDTTEKIYVDILETPEVNSLPEIEASGIAS